MTEHFAVRVNRYRESEAAEDGLSRVSYKPFLQAADDPDAAIVIKRDAQTLWLHLSDLDAVYRMTGDFHIATVSLEQIPAGTEL